MQDNSFYIKAFIEYLEYERNLSENTLLAYKRDIEQFLLWITLEKVAFNEVTTIEMKQYLFYLHQNDYTKKTISRKLSSIKSFYRFLIDDEYLERCSFLNLKAPKIEKRLPKVIGKESLIQFLDDLSMSADKFAMRDSAIFELLYGSGLRISELTALDLKDVKQADYLRVFGKGSKERLVPCSRRFQLSLKNYLEKSRPLLAKALDEEALFLNSKGTRLTSRGVRYLINHYEKKGELDYGISPHTFRHTFATHLLDNGADLRVIQEFLGHESLSTTEIYTSVSMTKLKEVYEKAHPRATIKEKSDD